MPVRHETSQQLFIRNIPLWANEKSLIPSPRASLSSSLPTRKITRIDQIITVSALNLRFWFKLLAVLLVKILAQFEVIELSK
jgi:hypothetical protein